MPSLHFASILIMMRHACRGCHGTTGDHSEGHKLIVFLGEMVPFNPSMAKEKFVVVTPTVTPIDFTLPAGPTPAWKAFVPTQLDIGSS